MGITKAPTDDWHAVAEEIWNKKSGLRYFYQTQIFDRISNELLPGRSLQLGSGALGIPDIFDGSLNSDIAFNDTLDVVFDVHKAPFSDGVFMNVIGIDVLHHFASPIVALQEAARVLEIGGRIIFVEPWAGLVGWPFYKYVHHEDCTKVENLWVDAFPENKKPMDGNTAIPIELFGDGGILLNQRIPQLRLVQSVPFGFTANILTGGFQKVGLPEGIIKVLCALENSLPHSISGAISMRCMFVLERVKCI